MTIVGQPVEDIIVETVATSPTYGEIKAKVAAWIVRGDLTSQIPDFINVAMTRLEKDFNYGFMEYALSGTLTGSSYIDMPIYFKAPKYMRVSYNGVTNELRQLEWSALQEIYKNTTYLAAPDKYYAVSRRDARIYFRPQCETGSGTQYVYDFAYYKYTAPLTNDNQYNNWTVEHWDALLYGALLEASIYLINDERVPMWKAKYDEAVSKIKMADDEIELANNQAIILPVNGIV